jgi:Flp pilus assembly protein TadG
MIRFSINAAFRILRRLIGDRRASVAVMTALMSPMILGGLGMGTEIAYWYVSQREMQNAADEAAIAAATNASASYATEAQAVAAQMGFTNGSNNITVTASNSAACPGGGNTCYSVTITGKAQVYLTQFVGYTGDTTVNGKNAVTLSATAIAKLDITQRQYCILALATSGTAFRTNGAPSANEAGCNIMSDANATCNGSNLNADIGDAHLTNGGGAGCGVIQDSNVPIVSDPYAGLAANIPANTCGGNYPQEPGKHGPALPASNQWSGSKTLGATSIVCGDLQLTGNTTITAASSSVLVIENGQLDTNGYTFATSSGGLTIIFSGTAGNYTHAPTGGGTLNFNAPTSGTWSGVALYQDPSLTTGVYISRPATAQPGTSRGWSICRMQI